MEQLISKGWLTITPSPNFNDGNLTKSNTNEQSINGDIGINYATQVR